ncbi:sensor histidine kinase [Myxococcus hansupus]|uniref:sensor histidine kinase n=1 Tax=Pseudomyxococcus hansupus TaxID=1297742 RepID=UPI0003AED8E7|nr:HAMP domain-containing sensor histidine kinase [Myxococcus hansupus]
MACLRFELLRSASGELLDLRWLAADASVGEEAGAATRLPARLSQWEDEGVRGLHVEDCARVLATGEPLSRVLCVPLGDTEARFRVVGMMAEDTFVLWLRPEPEEDDAQVLREALRDEREARRRVEGALEHVTARLAREAQDGTERHLAMARLSEEAEFRERFIGMLGHDLRNPLNAITLSARALSQRSLPVAQQQQCALRIESSAARMGTMISDILDLTRARLAGGIPLHLASVNLATVCRLVVEELATAHPDRRIDFDVVGRSEGFWDADRLAQVLSNLVGNALEHGAPAAPVTLRCRDVDSYQVLEVHNPGEPIASQHLETLFDPFRRVGSERDKGHRRGGLGLGLFIVKQIVQAHGGAVCVCSSEAEGTTFTVKLPRDARESQVSSPPGSRRFV